MIKLIFVLLVLSTFFFCCTPEKARKQKLDIHKVQQIGEQDYKLKNDKSSDEKQFRAVLKFFTKAVQNNKPNDLIEIMNFPFYTSKEEGVDGKGAALDPIEADELINYKAAIYTSDVLRLLPMVKEDNVSGIDVNQMEPYYKSLQPITDSGSMMYEVYMQYPEPNIQSESYFGFVFGRVKGEYKAIASYAKWPVK